MSRALFAAVVVAFLVALWAVDRTQAGLEGRYRIVCMNDRVVEGDLTERADGAYEVRTKHGAVMVVRKNEVKKMIRLDAEPATVKAGGAAPAAGMSSGITRVTGVRREVSDSEIEEILAGIVVPTDDVITEAGDDTKEELPIDEESVQEMERIAGSKSKRLRTPHFIVVYTSETGLARELASRLESIYRWVHRYQDMLQIPRRKPEHALEIFFFETHAEYRSYQSIQGWVDDNASGFYMRTNNRSAFFDNRTAPDIAPILERLKEKDIDPRARQYWTNRLIRKQDFWNLTVVQHEAAHHIHFNCGVYERINADLPRWCTEGLAQMFELPPTSAGGSLGATNQFRLYEFRILYGRSADILKALDLRLFIVDDSKWLGGQSYSLGWALQHYLYRTKRPAYTQFMQKLSQREPDVELTMTERQKEFEDLFGEVNEKWIEDFHKYIMALPFKPSVIPD